MLEVSFKLWYLPGQFCSLHFIVLSAGPVQSLPPSAGLGESQSRVWFKVPPPQETVQAEILFQQLHWPSTARKEEHCIVKNLEKHIRSSKNTYIA